MGITENKNGNYYLGFRVHLFSTADFSSLSSSALISDAT